LKLFNNFLDQIDKDKKTINKNSSNNKVEFQIQDSNLVNKQLDHKFPTQRDNLDYNFFDNFDMICDQFY